MSLERRDNPHESLSKSRKQSAQAIKDRNILFKSLIDLYRKLLTEGGLHNDSKAEVEAEIFFMQYHLGRRHLTEEELPLETARFLNRLEETNPEGVKHLLQPVESSRPRYKEHWMRIDQIRREVELRADFL